MDLSSFKGQASAQSEMLNLSFMYKSSDCVYLMFLDGAITGLAPYSIFFGNV